MQIFFCKAFFDSFCNIWVCIYWEVSMKKTLVIGVIVSSIIIFMACSSTSPIQVGFVGDLEGSSAFLSQSGLLGARLAVEEFNEAGGLNGRLVEILPKDNKGSLSGMKESLEYFKTSDVSVVIGPYLSHMAVPIFDDINESELLFLSPTVSSYEISDKDDNFIRLISEVNYQGEILANLAIKNKDKRFIIVYNEMNQSFTQVLSSDFKKNLETNDGRVLDVLIYNRLIDDIDALIEKIEIYDYDGILFLGNGFDTAFMSQRLFNQGLNNQLYVSLWSNTKDLFEEGGQAINGTYIIDFYNPNNKSQEYKKFYDDYTKAYGEEPTFSSVFTYETTKLYLEALRISGDTDWQSIKKAIIDLGVVEGVQSDFEIDAYGDSNRPYIPFQIINGELHTIE